MEFFDDFRDMLVALADAGADFVVVGGHALAFHGHPRATKDLDILVRPSEENAPRVLAALAAFGAPIRQLGIGLDDFLRPSVVVQLGLPPIRIDLLTAIDGLDFDGALREHGTLALDGRRIPVIGLAAFLTNKRAAGRPQDLADVAALEGERSEEATRAAYAAQPDSLAGGALAPSTWEPSTPARAQSAPAKSRAPRKRKR